jgi:hypothetical protein
VLRRIETMVERASRHFAPASDTAFLDFLERVGRPLEPHADGVAGEAEPAAPRIILP